MKKMVLVLVFSVSLFAGSITCDIYLKKSIEKSRLLVFAIERNDSIDIDRYSREKVLYLERTIAACNGVFSEDDISELSKQRADLISIRKSLNFN